MNEMSALITHYGGCHCGQVRYEVDAPAVITVQDCNCTICTMTGFLHLIVPRSQFRLLTSEDALAEYRWNTGVARHYFCKICGIKSFYTPRSNPDGVDVNARCLDQETIKQMIVESFDGQNWEANAHSLADLSKD